jgi:hypothetical protein
MRSPSSLTVVGCGREAGDPTAEVPTGVTRTKRLAKKSPTYPHATSLLFLVDFLAGRGAQEDALAEALEQEIDAVPRPTPPSVVQALRLMYLDRFDQARDPFAHALRRAANRGDEEMVEAVVFHSARLELRAGDWTRVASLADQISELGGQDLGHRPRAPCVDPGAARGARGTRERDGTRRRRP